jgi:hypothetical protein
MALACVQWFALPAITTMFSPLMAGGNIVIHTPREWTCLCRQGDNARNQCVQGSGADNLPRHGRDDMMPGIAIGEYVERCADVAGGVQSCPGIGGDSASRKDLSIEAPWLFQAEECNHLATCSFQF